MTELRFTCGISACLLGRLVRYDGGHRLQDWTPAGLAPDISWYAVCPEAGAGYGTPREPINVVDNHRLITVDTKIDVTPAMTAWIAAELDRLAAAAVAGYILKARSPSCGRGNVEVFPDAGMRTPASRTGDGLFVQALQQRFVGIPLANEEELETGVARALFAERIRAYARERA